MSGCDAIVKVKGRTAAVFSSEHGLQVHHCMWLISLRWSCAADQSRDDFLVWLAFPFDVTYV